VSVARPLRRAGDATLAGLVAVWAVAALLPLGTWAGAVEPGYYADAWALSARALGVALPATALVLVASRGGIVRAFARAADGVRRAPLAWYLAGLGAVAGGAAALVSALCFARNPQTVDAWAQYFQARVFLSGHLTAPPPPSIAHFATLHMLISDRVWVAQYPPLHPALLAVGLAAGAAWLVTPLATALFPAAVWAAARHAGGDRVARLAAALAALSPCVVAMGASGMNHVPAALCVALGLAALPAAARGRVPAGAALGAATGLLAGLRPLDAVVLAAVGAVPVLGALRRPGGWRAVAAVGATGVVALAPTLVFNAVTTGSPLTFTYVALYGDGLALGFHAAPWGAALTPLRAAIHTALDAHQLDVYLFEWPVPVTVLAAVAVARRRLPAGVRFAAAYLVLLVGTLFFYFHRDTLYGPRLLFSAVPAVLVLVASALVRLARARRPLGWQGVTAGQAFAVGMTVVALLAAVALAPRRLASYRTGGALALHPDEDAARAGVAHAVVVIPEGWGSRLIARMWDAGVPMAETGPLYHALDACALEELLARAEAEGVRGDALRARLAAAAATADRGRPAPGLTRDALLRLPRDGHVTPRCAAEIVRDRQGTLQYAPYAWLNAPALDGDVVWAREVGDAADAALRRAFPDRDLWRYAPPAGGGPPVLTRIATRTASR
jgi:hypothetical protein